MVCRSKTGVLKGRCLRKIKMILQPRMLLLDCVELSQACKAHSVSLFRETFVSPAGDSCILVTRASDLQVLLVTYDGRGQNKLRICFILPARGANRARPRNGVLSLYVLYRSTCHPFYSITPPTTYMKQSDFTYPLVLSTGVQRVGDPLM